MTAIAPEEVTLGLLGEKWAESGYEVPGRESRSPKSYATAVILSTPFGFIGLQHFYLGRWAEALLELGLSAHWAASGSGC